MGGEIYGARGSSIKREEEELHILAEVGQKYSFVPQIIIVNILFTVDRRLTARCWSGYHPSLHSLHTDRWLANLELISNTRELLYSGQSISRGPAYLEAHYSRTGYTLYRDLDFTFATMWYKYLRHGHLYDVAYIPIRGQQWLEEGLSLGCPGNHAYPAYIILELYECMQQRACRPLTDFYVALNDSI